METYLTQKCTQSIHRCDFFSQEKCYHWLHNAAFLFLCKQFLSRCLIRDIRCVSLGKQNIHQWHQYLFLAVVLWCSNIFYFIYTQDVSGQTDDCEYCALFVCDETDTALVTGWWITWESSLVPCTLLMVFMIYQAGNITILNRSVASKWWFSILTLIARFMGQHGAM